MGKKINPISFRLNINKNWKSKWFNTKSDYVHFLEEDLKIRELIFEKLKGAAIKDVTIERGEGVMRVKIFTGRPGIIIGRGGSGIEDLRKTILKLLMSLRSKRIKNGVTNKKIAKTTVEIDVEDVKNFEENAVLVARSVADQIEKRVSFRRALKSTLDSVMKQKNVKGAKIMIAGRLNGAEMSRTEWVIKGGIPLHTLRSNIDYGKCEAYTTYGVIGVKVWIYKGEVFQKKQVR
ncbi:MAG: 30S ribosomal protein S3 [Candidatus Moranbacteria bacterium]|nr:30S ribosomal protein S3 [Candidatus Moranbacteria bacterium]